jgi:O-methyltransferase involved in polyketide biosynthesis
MQTEKIHLTQEKETMLGTLYGRALESRSANPILRDQLARRVTGWCQRIGQRSSLQKA